jgi:hypothetical protein
MAQPYDHPIDKLLATAQESARLMWRAYDLCMNLPDRSPEWQKESRVRYEHAMAADARVWRLHDLREGLRSAPGDKAKSTDLLSKLQQAVTTLHDCQCFHEGGFFVDEIIDGHGSWMGAVEVFTLKRHPEATHAFAWAWDDRGELRYHVFLRVPPIDSPSAAVRAAIATSPHAGSIPHVLIP